MKSRRPAPSKERIALLCELETTKRALEAAYAGFEYALDPELIDSCIYEVNAIQHRYHYLLRELKKEDGGSYATAVSAVSAVSVLNIE